MAEVVAHISVDIGFTIEVTVGVITGEPEPGSLGVGAVLPGVSITGPAPDPASAPEGPGATGVRGRWAAGSALQAAPRHTSHTNHAVL